jgi:hypothetical protein
MPSLVGMGEQNEEGEESEHPRDEGGSLDPIIHPSLNGSQSSPSSLSSPEIEEGSP